MTARAAALQRRTPHHRNAGIRPPVVHSWSEPRRLRPTAPVVALLDGGPDDAEVVDVALGSCVRRGRDLRLVHMYGTPGIATTPLADAFAREYASGAIAVAGLVPGVSASTVCIPWETRGALRREVLNAELLVASVDRAAEMIDAARPSREGGRGVRIVTVPGAPTDTERLRMGYRLALLRELERPGERLDGSTTPEALDDAWHVGVACPPLSADTIRAWAACSAWPPRTGPDPDATASRAGHLRGRRGPVRLAVVHSRA